MKFIKKYLLSISFILFIFLFSLIDIIEPNKGYSELENRTLNKKPNLSYDKLISGQYTDDYEKYINDQFLLRNTWISIKSQNEQLLNKQENNGIIFGENGYLFDKHINLNNSYLESNVNAINEFVAEYELNTSLMLIPSSYEIYKDLLPKGIQLIDQESYIKEIYSRFNGNTINLYPTFNSEKENYIYYKTDHHWTTYGAYLAYSDYCEQQRISSVNLELLKPNYINDFYGTYFSKTLSIKGEPDIITYYENDELTIRINDDSKDSLYNLEKFNERDKYAAFLWGNNGYTKIINNDIAHNRKGSKLLLIKDSYGNSFAPFIVNNYEEVHIVDLRDYRGNLNELINTNELKDTLILYSFKNFSTDTNILKLNLH